MRWIIGSLALVCALLLAFAPARTTAQTGKIFVPQQCQAICDGRRLLDVSTAGDDFFNIDPSKPGPFANTRASTWGVSLLRLVREAVLRPAGPAGPPRTITPPAVARLLGGYSLAVYQAFAVWSEYLYSYGRYFQPLSSDMVNLQNPAGAYAWDVLTVARTIADQRFNGDYAPPEGVASDAQHAAISGAASKFLLLFFCNDRSLQSVWCEAAEREVNAAMAFVGNADKANFTVPFQQGEDIAVMVFEQLGMVNLLYDNTTTLSLRREELFNIPEHVSNRSQPTAAVHNCSRVWDALGGPWKWQRLTVPKVNIFRPNANVTLSPFPPPEYASLSPGNLSTPFYRGYAAMITPAALRSTDASRQMLLAGLNGPPGKNDQASFRRAMREVLLSSATLDDKKKVVAEFWADGPESTTPPGHWYKIAIEESNTNGESALKQLNALDRTIWATLLVGLSLHEAGLMSWELKLQHMGARPITGIQCLIGRNQLTNTSRTGFTWRGPYMGVGRRDLGTWQPFQNVTFITPPFPGYVSGHATFSAAAAEALRQTRSGFNTTFVTPGYNCYVTPAGKSTVEPFIAANQPGHVAGVTDTPNRGPRTVGFSPAKDVVMCWQKYEDAARQAAESRQYGGIHIRVDNDDGLTLGKRIGETVAASLARLSPENYMTKHPIDSRPPALRGVVDANNNNLANEYVCPPKTFVRAWDGKHDEKGLYALGVTCSDGTFIGTLGAWGPGTDEFMELTQSDGYSAVRVRQNPVGGVVAISFQDRSEDFDKQKSQWYGVPTGEVVSTACPDGQRLVGLTTRSTGGRGNIGSFGLLCAIVYVEDVTYRSDGTVPANPLQPDSSWVYDYSCPEGTFITRFFGKAGAYINTLTAQCGRVWNLKQVGLNRYAKPTDYPYSDTSVDGYLGIRVKSYSGDVDCIQLIDAAGGLSAVIGNQNAVPGEWTELRCLDESKIIGIFGSEAGYLATIGIICGPGEYDGVPTSAKVLRMRRNSMQKLRIPAREILPISSSDAVTAASIDWPSKPIPTRVTGTARKRQAPGSVQLQPGVTQLATAVPGDHNQGLQVASAALEQPSNLSLVELPLQVLTEAGPADSSTSSLLNQTSESPQPL